MTSKSTFLCPYFGVPSRLHYCVCFCPQPACPLSFSSKPCRSAQSDELDHRLLLWQQQSRGLVASKFMEHYILTNRSPAHSTFTAGRLSNMFQHVNGNVRGLRSSNTSPLSKVGGEGMCVASSNSYRALKPKIRFREHCQLLDRGGVDAIQCTVRFPSCRLDFAGGHCDGQQKQPRHTNTLMDVR
jgi:hypothetical protein